jgi:hypothetical protein
MDDQKIGINQPENRREPPEIRRYTLREIRPQQKNRGQYIEYQYYIFNAPFQNRRKGFMKGAI